MTDLPHDNRVPTADDEAADWLVRLQSDEATGDDWQAFEQWLEAPEHRAAFDRAEAMWVELDDAGEAVAARIAASAPIPIESARIRRRQRASRSWLAYAAALAATIAAVAILAPRNQPPPAAGFETAKGENRLIELADGSKVHLNSGSKILVRMEKSTRRVEMASAEGEAAFDVAKDPARPFVILAGDRTIRVVGTEFNVRRVAGRLLVTVRRGVVEVASLDKSAPTVRLTPGEELSHHEGAADATVKSVDPAIAFAWKAGDLIYRDQPLGEVVADLNRYFRVPLRVDAPASKLRFTGVLKIDEEDAVVRRLQAFLPITARRSSEGVVLRLKASSN